MLLYVEDALEIPGTSFTSIITFTIFRPDPTDPYETSITISNTIPASTCPCIFKSM